MLDTSLSQYSNIDKIGLLTELSIRSLFVKSLVCEEPERKQAFRTSINVLLIAPSGSAKSTLLSEIARVYTESYRKRSTKVWTGLSNASIVGTITKDGELQTGAAWGSFMRPLLIDEFAMRGDRLGSLDGLLQILENQCYNKGLGFVSKRPIFEKSKNPSGYYFKCEGGTIEVKTKTAAIIATMRELWRSTSVGTDALFSRTLPFIWETTRDELRKIAMGKSILPPLNLPKKLELKDVVVSNADYMKIVEFVDSKELADHHYLRTIGDCCRVFALYGRHREDVYEFVCGLKKDFDIRHGEYVEWRAANAAQKRWK